MNKRVIEIAVISDLHLATHACKPKKILEYLKTIQPEILVLNGDIIDSWRFTRNYFPKSQLKVIRRFIKMMEKGTRIYYVSGNHDEFLRKFSGTKIGRLEIVNQYVFEYEGEKTWIFHGDIFDKIIHRSKGVAKLGAALYGLLTIVNQLINVLIRKCGGQELIIYKVLKKNFVRKKKSSTKFEAELARSAVAQGYATVICGHTHLPKYETLETGGQQIKYINCGDWVEHLTAAEFYNGRWHLYTHPEVDADTTADEFDIPAEPVIYQTLLKELTFSNLKHS